MALKKEDLTPRGLALMNLLYAELRRDIRNVRQPFSEKVKMIAGVRLRALELAFALDAQLDDEAARLGHNVELRARFDILLRQWREWGRQIEHDNRTTEQVLEVCCQELGIAMVDAFGFPGDADADVHEAIKARNKRLVAGILDALRKAPPESDGDGQEVCLQCAGLGGIDNQTCSRCKGTGRVSPDQNPFQVLDDSDGEVQDG